MKPHKNARGNWACETLLRLTDDLVLAIHTTKRHSGKLVTTAQVHQRSGKVFLFAPFSDFNKTLISEEKRSTMKAVVDQHNQVFSNQDSFLELKYQAIDFYNHAI